MLDNTRYLCQPLFLPASNTETATSYTVSPQHLDISSCSRSLTFMQDDERNKARQLNPRDLT